MRDFASCFGENAVRLSDTSCSSRSNNSTISPSLIPSTRDSVTCFYRTVLSTQKQVLITVTWCKNALTQGLNITLGDDYSSSFKLNTNSRLFRKLKGSKSMEFTDSKVEVFWDLSTAQYQTGPEPMDGYYVLIMFGSELGLILGDMVDEAMARKLKTGTRIAKFSLLSRQEHFSGSTLYSTKVQFSETGVPHDILIRCSGEDEGLKYPVLSVCVDKKMVTRVDRLQWNFRGNQTIFLDGLLVDLMWDVHDWIHNSGQGYAVFMFRTRSGVDNRLWMEEKMVQKDQDKVEFSLIIYACKNM
ncbi:uncharacterized protein LOC142538801 [Primulina tabacum]|uniref:uncharacterized protein LOC142538801 n=1 Tax=Primulina tabacum TaxID=48773 RepID=UPI003F59ACF1